MAADAPEPQPRPVPASAGRRRRLFPAFVVTVALLALAVFWLTPWLDRDVRNFLTVPLIAAALLLLGGWFLLFSAVTRWRRLAIVSGTAVVVAVLAGMLRLDGYTGDMKPTIVFRWTPKADRLLEPPSAKSAAADADQMLANVAKTTSHDYPQFLGPHRIPMVTGIELARDWEARPPILRWRQPIGGGWSAFAVVGDYAVTQEQRGDLEMVVCYEVHSGRTVWSHADRGRFTSVLGSDGPRATPTIDHGRIYSQSPRGPLHCLDGRDGSVVWRHDILKENGADNINWGRSGSPLVVDDLVIVSAGGLDDRSLVAYQAETGALVWGGGSDVSSYSSPALTTLCGVRQVLVVNQDWVVGHRLSDGKPLWRHPWPGRSNSNASTSQPVAVGGDRVFLSKGYGIGCALLQLSRDDRDGFAVEVVWQRPTLMKTKLDQRRPSRRPRVRAESGCLGVRRFGQRTAPLETRALRPRSDPARGQSVGGHGRNGGSCARRGIPQALPRTGPIPGD